MACNDYGFVLQSSKDPLILFEEVQGWFAEEGLLDDILSGLNATEMSRRQFREIARIAGLIQIGYPGEKRLGRHLQASSDLIFDALRAYDPDNLLLRQAQNEVLKNQLDWERLRVRLTEFSIVRFYGTSLNGRHRWRFPFWWIVSETE